MERRFIDGEHAEIDETGGDQPAPGVDDFVAVMRFTPNRVDTTFDQP